MSEWLLFLATVVVAVAAVWVVVLWRTYRSPWRVTLRRRRDARLLDELNPPAWVSGAKPAVVQPHELTGAELDAHIGASMRELYHAQAKAGALLHEQAVRIAALRLGAEVDNHNRRTAP